MLRLLVLKSTILLLLCIHLYLYVYIYIYMYVIIIVKNLLLTIFYDMCFVYSFKMQITFYNNITFV